MKGNPKPLSDHLIGWFASYRVEDKAGKLEVPSRSTFEANLSHITTTILQRSQGRVDIKVSSVFEDFCLFLDGYKKNLKALGKGEVKSYEGKCPELTVL